MRPSTMDDFSSSDTTVIGEPAMRALFAIPTHEPVTQPTLISSGVEFAVIDDATLVFCAAGTFCGLRQPHETAITSTSSVLVTIVRPVWCVGGELPDPVRGAHGVQPGVRVGIRAECDGDVLRVFTLDVDGARPRDVHV